MTSMGNSEFALTTFGALAQEERANTFKRVKIGRKLAEQLKENIRFFGRAILECLEYFTNENIISKEVAGNCIKEAAEKKVEMLKKIMEG